MLRDMKTWGEAKGQGLLGVWAVRAQAVSTSFFSSPLFLAGSHLTKGCCLAPAADARDLELVLTSFAFPSHTQRPVPPFFPLFLRFFLFPLLPTGSDNHAYSLRQVIWLVSMCVCVFEYIFTSVCKCACPRMHVHMEARTNVSYLNQSLSSFVLFLKQSLTLHSRLAPNSFHSQGICHRL